MKHGSISGMNEPDLVYVCKWWAFLSTIINCGVRDTGHHRSSQVLFFQSATTVDGRNPAPVDMVNILIYHHLLLGFIHVRWCRISSINSVSADQEASTILNGGTYEKKSYLDPPGRYFQSCNWIGFSVRNQADQLV